MIKIVKRDVTVIFCDRCGKELVGEYSIIGYSDKEPMDLCSDTDTHNRKSCFNKQKEDDLEESRKNKK